MTIKEYSTYKGVAEIHKISDIQYISNREISIRLEQPFLENVHTHLMIPPRNYDNLKKSKKMGTLLLICTISICAALTAVVLPLPWSLISIGFGGPLITLIKRMFKE